MTRAALTYALLLGAALQLFFVLPSEALIVAWVVATAILWALGDLRRPR